MYISLFSNFPLQSLQIKTSFWKVKRTYYFFAHSFMFFKSFLFVKCLFAPWNSTFEFVFKMCFLMCVKMAICVKLLSANCLTSIFLSLLNITCEKLKSKMGLRLNMSFQISDLIILFITTLEWTKELGFHLKIRRLHLKINFR